MTAPARAFAPEGARVVAPDYCARCAMPGGALRHAGSDLCPGLPALPLTLAGYLAEHVGPRVWETLRGLERDDLRRVAEWLEGEAGLIRWTAEQPSPVTR